MSYIFWLALTIVFTILEFIIPALVTVWFALGAALTIFISIFCDNLKIEIVFFTIFSVISLLLLRPYVKRKYSQKNKNLSETLIDTSIIVEKVLDISKDLKEYEVKYKGSTWTAISRDTFEVGEKPLIKSFKGNKIIIKK